MCLIGEVMGVGDMFEEVYVKVNFGVGVLLLKEGKVFIFVCEIDKLKIIELVKVFVVVGFSIEVMCGIVMILYDVGIMSMVVNKLFEG